MATLAISSDHLQQLSIKAREIINAIEPDPPNDALILEMELITSKLESGLNRLKSDLNNYFRFVKEPAVDEVSRIATIQLEVEETLCELQVQLRRARTTSSRDGAIPVSGKLPKLSLPEFHGDILQWNQFWDQYQSLVDCRKLSDVDKFLYLNSALKGEAQKLVEGLGITNKNYGIAVNTLKARYGRVELVKDAHYSALSKITPAEDSTSSCRNVLNEIEKHLRVLSSLGEDTTHSYLRFLILERFPEEIVYELKKRIPDDSVPEIRKGLEALIAAKEDAHRFTSRRGESTSENYTTETLHVNERFVTDRGQNNRRVNDAIKKDWNTPTSSASNQRFKRKFEYRDGNSWNKGLPREPLMKKLKQSCTFCGAEHFRDECRRYPEVHQRKARLTNQCFRCLRIGHRAATCTARTPCAYCRSAYHHRSLCPRKTTVSEPTNNPRSQGAGEGRRNERTEATVTNHTSDNIQCQVRDTGFTVLQTAIADLTGESDCDKVKGRILLDSGSMRTYITKGLVKELKLIPIEENRLTIFTFGSEVPQEVDSPRVRFKIATRSGETILIDANVVPMITHGVRYFGPDRERGNSKYDIADDGSLGDRVDLLIGNDYYFSLLLPEKIEIQENLFMVNSKLGWILSGKSASKPVNELEVVTYFQTSLEVGLNQPDLPLHDVNLKELWELETIGIVDSPKENRDEEAIRHFNETTRFEDGRYQVSWPWTEYPPDLEPNFGLALGRLVGLMKRLETDTLKSYDQLIREQMDMDIVEVVPDEETNSSSHPVHYLPHHFVEQKEKGTLRIVYDASSKIKDKKSLNQCLYCGPLLLEDLTGILLKFRSHNIGICADVEKAFLQIGLQDKDRDVTRFLWIKDIDKPLNENNVIHMRFRRVPFGVISSPFLLNATIKYHLSKSNLENVRRIAQDIYVDNMVTGTDTVEEALDLYNNTKQEFQQMSMNLREWSSNSHDFLSQAPDSCPDEVVKVLGLDWNLKTDALHLRQKKREYSNTKRGVLRCIASVYDPCGYAAPLVLAAKLLLQDLWKLKVKWDCPLTGDLADRWEKAKEELKNLKDTSVPRCCVKNLQRESYSIHCFTDASTKAYATVVYIVQGNTRNFVIGKSRLVPSKDQDDLKIPKLELIAALIGHRLIQYVKKFLQGDITEQILWTDSQVVIGWFHSDKLLTPFVSRRIQEMKKNKGLKVRYVPTYLNPADVATRPARPREEIEQWLVGPEFLSREPADWPISPNNNSSLLAGEGLSCAPMEEDLDDRKKQDETDNSSIIASKKVAHEDFGIMYTEVSEIKEIQAKHFPEELAGKETSLRRNLGLFTDEDGILRSKGRLQYANWTYDKRYPILLPHNSPHTDRIIMKTHTDNYHVGAAHTLTIIRQNFWIPQGKRRVLSVIGKCTQCIKQRGGPFKLPPTPALPPERVNYTEPYTFTGVDYLGPILVNTKTGTEKRWVCLFTCLAVRAIHLEVVRDLTAEEGLLALRRFIATRNVPTVITSDNATNLKLMSEVMTQPYCINKKIKWRFIPQLAPWFGGFYERLVGMVKVCMRTTLQKHLLTDNQLNTIVKEIEAVINSRPLTYVDEELDHILKPSDFIAMGRTIAIETNSDGPLPEGTQAKKDLVNSWKKGIVILDEFKKMFIDRYLLSLRERYSHSHKQPRCTSKLEPSVNQIVQIKGDTKNREDWKVGKIISLVKGTDNRCRVAQVKVGDKVFTRSLAQLYPLEMEDEASNETGSSPMNIEESRGTLDGSQDLNIDLEVEDTDELPLCSEGGQEPFNDTESIQEEINPERATSPYDVNRDGSVDDAIGASPRPRQPRDAAVRAREKIRQWTRSLMSLLLAVGSVANAEHRDDK